MSIGELLHELNTMGVSFHSPASNPLLTVRHTRFLSDDRRDRGLAIRPGVTVG